MMMMLIVFAHLTSVYIEMHIILFFFIASKNVLLKDIF